MVPRLASSIFGIPILLLLAYWGSYPWSIFLCVIGVIGLNEFASAYRMKPEDRWPLYSASLLPLFISLGEHAGVPWNSFQLLAAGGVVWFILFACTLVLRANSSDVEKQPNILNEWSVYIAGVMYIPFLLSFGAAIRTGEAGLYWLIFTLIITWSNDTSAFFAGMLIGGRRLAPKISPNKTVSGSIGGVIGATIAAWLLFHANWWQPGREVGLVVLLLIGIVLAVAGQAGDLFESFWKRSNGIKDSGNIIPGHGGVLDRFDSLLFVWPIAYIVVHAISGAG